MTTVAAYLKSLPREPPRRIEAPQAIELLELTWKTQQALEPLDGAQLTGRPFPVRGVDGSFLCPDYQAFVAETEATLAAAELSWDELWPQILERLAAECSRLAAEVRQASVDQKAAREVQMADLLAAMTDPSVTGEPRSAADEAALKAWGVD
jgi:hypothetical protein